MRTHMIILAPPAAIAKNAAKITKGALEAMLDYWHGKYAPLHFQDIAYTRYKYRRRSESTKLDKRLNRKVHMPPLVLSGRLRRDILRSISLTGGKSLVRGKMDAPNYVNIIKRRADGSGGINKAREILTTTSSEVSKMANIFDQAIQLGIDGVQDIEEVTL